MLHLKGWRAAPQDNDRPVYERETACVHQTKALPCAAPIKYDNAAFSQQCLMDFLWLCLVIAWPPAPWPLSALGKLDEKHAAPPAPVGLQRDGEAPNPHMTEGRYRQAALPDAAASNLSWK